MTSVWTEKNLERTKVLLAEGYSGSQIAADLGGGITRNAVIGACNRHGWKGPKSSVKVDAPRAPRKSPPRTVKVAGKVRHNKHRVVVREFERGFENNCQSDFDIPFGQPKTFLDLTADTCKWPVGNPDEPDFFFCGGKTAKGSYCAHHFRRSVTSKAYGAYAWHK